MSRPIYQPIHPDLRDHLDPEYVAFHDEHFQYILPSEATPWDPGVRTAWSPAKLAALEAVEVGSSEDVVLEHSQLRIFTPTSSVPRDGWPVFVWLHGGICPRFRI
jgi:carboxylesterase type B